MSEWDPTERMPPMKLPHEYEIDALRAENAKLRKRVVLLEKTIRGMTAGIRMCNAVCADLEAAALAPAGQGESGEGS